MENNEIPETDAAHPYNQAVAEELRLQLTRSRKKPIDVARETGIKSASLARYLDGERAIRVATLSLIAGAIGSTATEILDRAQKALEG